MRSNAFGVSDISIASLARRVHLALFALLIGGCGSSPHCIPVSGTVTLDGGVVPGPGFIYFTSDAKEGLARPGTAEFDAAGSYRASTFVRGDGLLPGKYLLRVDCWKQAPNMEGKPVVSFLPRKYQDAATSGLELTVAPDASPITFDIKLTSRD